MAKKSAASWSASANVKQPQWRAFAENEWNFDLSGFVVLPGLLGDEELGECRRAAAAGVAALLDLDLAAHAGLQDGIQHLLGTDTPLLSHALWSEPIEFREDRPPALLARSDEEQDFLPGCCDVLERRRLMYDESSRPDAVNVRGLRVLWVLGPTTDVVLVPGSHRTSSFAAPSLHRAEAMGATVRPRLAAGDVLLCAATTLVGVCAGGPTALSDGGGAAEPVVELLLVDHNLCAPGLGYVERPQTEVPAWFHELSAEQQQVMGPRCVVP